MRKSIVLIIMCTTTMVAAASWISAQQKRPSRLTAEDYMEIQQLYQSYQRGVDGGPQDSSWVFTPDGAFVNGGRTVSGEKALKEFYANVNKTHVDKIRHLLSNIIVSPLSEGANGSAYLFTIDGTDSSKPSMIVYYGVYDDMLVKTAAGWRIKRRVYRQDWPPPGAPQRH